MASKKKATKSKKTSTPKNKPMRFTSAKSNTNIKFHPAAGYILIQPLKAETKTQGGIYLPDSVSEKPQTGIVIAVGDTETTDYGTVRKSPVVSGNTVIYKKWGGNEVKFEGIEYVFIKFEDVLAIETK